MRTLILFGVLMSQSLFAFNENDNVEWDRVIDKNKAILESIQLIGASSEITSIFDNSDSDHFTTLSCDGVSPKDSRSRRDLPTDRCGLISEASFYTDANGNGTPAGFNYQQLFCPHTWVDKLSWKRSDGRKIDIHLEYRVKCDRILPKTDAKRKKYEVSIRGIRERDLIEEGHEAANEKIARFISSLNFSLQSRAEWVREMAPGMRIGAEIFSKFRGSQDAGVQTAYTNKINQFCSQARTAYGANFERVGGDTLTRGRAVDLCRNASVTSSAPTSDSSTEEPPQENDDDGEE